MKVQRVVVRGFKRFTDLTVQGIADTARLVILAGPNGCGKSSLFDALYVWHRLHMMRAGNWEESYHEKQVGGPRIDIGNAVQVSFHDPQPVTEDEKRKALYVRSAYRNEPEFQLNQLTRTGSALDETRLYRMIDNDITVGKNYQRLASQGLLDLYERRDAGTTFGEYREESIGELKASLTRLFPDLVLNSLGDPLATGTFKFDKGASRGFVYKNLSGGEKAAFDLLLDIVVKKRDYDNTVFLIDEPEAHMNTRLQGALLQELYTMVPAGSQLWLATHSIGMMRRARDLWSANREHVVFLDLDGKDFDQPQTLEPIMPTRVFWQRVLRVALDDMSELVAPNRVIICEGKPLGAGSGNVAIDAACYNEVFADEFPDTRFLSGGNHHDVQNDRLALMEAIKALVGGTNVIRLIDRDDLSPTEVAEEQGQGVHVLSRRHLESYLYDDEVLTALCLANGRPEEVEHILEEKAAALVAARERGRPPDDVKAAAPQIYTAARRRLELTQCGNDYRSFMRDTLAPLMRREMVAYQELRRDIFRV